MKSAWILFYNGACVKSGIAGKDSRLHGGKKKKKARQKAPPGKAKTSLDQACPAEKQSLRKRHFGPKRQKKWPVGRSGNASREMQGVICAALGLFLPAFS